MSAIIDYLGESSGTVRLPGIMTLGYVAAHSENLAMTVIVSKGVSQLAICLGNREKWKQISIVDQERVFKFLLKPHNQQMIFQLRSQKTTSRPLRYGLLDKLVDTRRNTPKQLHSLACYRES